MKKLKWFLFNKNSKSTFWEIEPWINFNFIHIAIAAKSCDLPLIALYYIEIWYNKQLKLTNYNFNHNNLFKNEPHIINLLINSYKIIGENDAISENLSFLNSILNNKRSFSNECNEFGVLFNYDAHLYSNDVENNIEDRCNLINSLQNCSLNYLLNSYLMNPINENINEKRLNDLKYSCAIKLKNWNLDTNINEFELTKNKLIYQIANIMVNETKNKIKIISLCEKGKKLLLNDLINENSNLEPIIADLYNIEQINRSLDIETNNFEIMNESLFNLKNSSFNLVDSIYTNRILIFKSFLSRSNCNEISLKNKITNSIFKFYDLLIDNSILHKRFQIGENYINEMKTLNIASQNIELLINYKKSELLFEKREYTNARLLIKHTMDTINIDRLSIDKENMIEQYIKCLNLYARILHIIKCENPNKIINNYLELSIKLIKKYNFNNKSIETNSYFQLAKFADMQFQQINSYLKSTTFEEKQELIKTFKLESKEIEKLDPDSKLHLILRKQLDIGMFFFFLLLYQGFA